MKFLLNKNPVDSEDFKKMFQREAEILETSSDLDLTFHVDNGILKLESPHSGPVFIDAMSKLNYHQKYFYKNSIYKEPIAKAIGLKKSIEKPSILDATAGLLGDTLLMYSMGVEVSCCERNPIAAALCQNAINYNNLEIQLYHSSVIDINIESFDVVYFDPMYSQKNKKSAPKKEMQLFRDLIGEDLDARETAKFIAQKVSRLVIKRSIKAHPLLEKPSMTFEGKSTAYDVYLSTNK